MKRFFFLGLLSLCLVTLSQAQTTDDTPKWTCQDISLPGNKIVEIVKGETSYEIPKVLTAAEEAAAKKKAEDAGNEYKPAQKQFVRPWWEKIDGQFSAENFQIISVPANPKEFLCPDVKLTPNPYVIPTVKAALVKDACQQKLHELQRICQTELDKLLKEESVYETEKSIKTRLKVLTGNEAGTIVDGAENGEIGAITSEKKTQKYLLKRFPNLVNFLKQNFADEVKFTDETKATEPEKKLKTDYEAIQVKIKALDIQKTGTEAQTNEKLTEIKGLLLTLSDDLKKFPAEKPEYFGTAKKNLILQAITVFDKNYQADYAKVQAQMEKSIKEAQTEVEALLQKLKELNNKNLRTNADKIKDLRAKIQYLLLRGNQLNQDLLFQGVNTYPVTKVLRTTRNSRESDLRLINAYSETAEGRIYCETNKKAHDERTDEFADKQARLEYTRLCQPNLFDRVIQIVTGIIATIGVALGLTGVVFMITARGDEAQIEKGKNLIIGSMIGLAIIFLSFTVVQFVVSFLLW